MRAASVAAAKATAAAEVAAARELAAAERRGRWQGGRPPLPTRDVWDREGVRVEGVRGRGEGEEKLARTVFGSLPASATRPLIRRSFSRGAR